MSFLDKISRAFQSDIERTKCARCQREMHVVSFSGSGSVSLNNYEVASNIGSAEQCWECNRLY